MKLPCRINKKKQKGDVSSISIETFIIVVVMSCKGLDLFKQRNVEPLS